MDQMRLSGRDEGINVVVSSLCAACDDPEKVIQSIKNIFPDANIYENMKADYPYRADIPKSDVISTMVERVDRIDYPNFKNSVKDKAYARALNHVWNVLWTYGADYRQFPEKWWDDEDWKE